MVSYREILGLTSLGYTQRQIAASLHSFRSTISEVQELARKADLSFPLDESVTNEILLMTFHPERLTATNPRVEPEHSDCLNTSELYDLFCNVWGEGASWRTIKYEGSHEANLLRLDTSRAKTKLRWRPIWNVNRAVEETVSWYKAYSNGDDMTRFTDEQIRMYLEEASDWKGS